MASVKGNKLDRDYRNRKKINGCHYTCCGFVIGFLTGSIVLTMIIALYTRNLNTGASAKAIISMTTINDTNVTITTNTTLTTSDTKTTPTLYWVSGPQFGLDPNLLSTSGWRECYNSTYATSLSLSVITTILTQCRKTKLLLACKPASAVNYTLAAMGVRSDVLFNCATVSSCTRVANGVAWYFSTTYSWGFAQAGDPVSRSSCDTNPINPTARLCWHTNGGSGYRCGSTTGLHSDTNWIRSIWHAD